MITRWLADLSQAWRSLRRTPFVTTVSIVCLAGAIAAATTVFAAVDAVVLHALPFQNGPRLVAIWGVDPSRDRVLRGFSWPDVQDAAREARSLAAVAAMANTNGGMTLTGRGDPIQIQARVVSGNFFDALGVSPAIGRLLGPRDDVPGSQPVVVLSDDVWREHFGADRGVAGTIAVLEGRPFVVAGVAPAWFDFPKGARLWTTIAHGEPDVAANRGLGWLEVIGLMAPGATESSVTAELAPIFDRLTRTYHPLRGKETIAVRPLAREFLGDARPAMWAILAAVLTLMLVAAANVGGLLLVRGTSRAREVALRVALGAGRRQILRQALAESLALSLASGAAAAVLAPGLLRLLRALAPPGIPRLAEAGISTAAWLFGLAIVAATTAVCALVPAARASSANVRALLHQGGRGVADDRAWLRRGLAAAEVALAVVLMASAGLVGRTLVALRHVDVGFAADRVLAFDVPLPPTRYATPEAARAFADRLLPELSALPGVRRAAAVLIRPLWGIVGMDWRVTIEGQPPDEAARNPLVNLEAVSPGYFDTLEMPIEEGRDVRDGDRDGAAPVVVVGRSFANRFWPGRDAVGRRLRMPLPGSPYDGQWFTVVGVARDARYRGLRDARLDLYISAAQSPYPAHNFVVNADASAVPALLPSIRRAVRAIDPELPLDDVLLLRDAVGGELANPAFTAAVFGVFALSALVLAALGLGTLMAWQVRQRTRELGIRLALGADPARIVRLVVGESAGIVAGGIAAGILLALAASRLLMSLLYETSPADPVSLAAATTIAAIVTIGSAYVPARRTTRIDPLIALREEA